MKRIASWIIKYRGLIILTTVLLTLFFSYHLRHIRINSDIIRSLPDDDSVAYYYKMIGKKYQGTAMGMIILESDNVYVPSVMHEVLQVTDTLKSIPGVTTVTSLTNVIHIHSDTSGIVIGKLVDEYQMPVSRHDFDELRKKVNESDMYKGTLVSEDEKATMILFTLASEVNQEEVSALIREKVQAMKLHSRVLYGGTPMMMLDLSEYVFKDMVWLVPLITIVLMVILFFSFRSFRGVILPILTVSIASIWTLGLMTMLHYEITMVGGVIPVVLFAVGSAYAIHVVNHVRKSLSVNQEGFVEALAYLLVPVFLSALTTVFGFVSFIFGSYLIMIKDFGLFTAIGTLFSFILSVTFIPAILYYLPEQQINFYEKESLQHVLEKYVLVPLKNLLFRHPRYIFTLWLLILLTGIVGSFRIVRSTNIAAYFKKETPARVSEELLQKKFGGSSPIYVQVKGDMQDPEVLQSMLQIEKFLKTNPYITKTLSVADLIEEMNDAMGEGKKIPEERAKVEQLWFLLEGQDVMSQLVSDDLQEGIIQSRFASVRSSDTKQFVKSFYQFLYNHPPHHCIVTLTGMPSVYCQLDESLINSQLSSLMLASGLVFLLIGFSLRSFRLGLFGLIPILATVIMLFGFMGFTGIPLDIATVMVASLVIGIGIDYSIHVISSFTYHSQQLQDLEEIIRRMMQSTGRSIVINVFSVAIGFLVLLFSQLIPLRYLGLLVALSMLISGLGALTLLPVIIILDYRKYPFKYIKK